MPPFVSTLAFRLIAAGVIVLILLFAVTQCSGQRQKAEQSGQDARSATAEAETARDVAETVIANSEKNASTDELVRETVKEMDNVKDPKAAAVAARRAICDLMPDSCQHPAK